MKVNIPAVKFAELCIRNYIVELESFSSYIPIFIYFAYSLLCLKGSVMLKLWISLLIQMIVLAIAFLTNLFLCNIIGYNPNEMITVFNSTRVVGVILTKIILFYVTRIILKSKYKNPLDKNIWFLLILIPMFSIISICFLMIAAFRHEEIKGYISVGISCIVLVNIITYYFFTVLNKSYESKLKIRLLEQQNENVKKNMEDLEGFVQKMKEAKHDMKNQLVIIDNYVSSGNADKAHEYITKLTGEYIPVVQDFINTGNEAFDAVVNSKIAICNKKRIYIDIKIAKEANIHLDDIDIGILFGNALDNSIEAAQNSEDKRIEIEISRNEAYLSVIVSNSISQSVLSENTNLQTSKKDKELHGIGIKSIKNVVKKYDGMISFFEEEKVFYCHILFPI